MSSRVAVIALGLQAIVAIVPGARGTGSGRVLVAGLPSSGAGVFDVGASSGAQPAVSGAPARFRVVVPHVDAELAVDGEPSSLTGPLREIETPPLAPDRPHAFTFTVTWRPNEYTVMTRTKTVHVTAGDAITLDLTRAEPTDRAEVRYVPTPSAVVREMIRLAGITENDVVYEPGCGDARITVAAVKAGAARGVGIDLNASRVADAETRVREANLEDRIEIRQGDALEIEDLSAATVVFLYMGDEFNRLIRPILWRQLDVGARVVSHRFTMDDWMPDETVTLPGDGAGNGPRVSNVHLWTITEEIKRKVAQP